MNALLVIVAAMLGTSQAGNCFQDNHLDYVYSLPDFTGNYSNVREYWLRKDTSCDFLIKYDSKLEWYSSNITAQYQMYYYKGNDQCRGDIETYDYVESFPVVIGPQNDNSCLVKYFVRNSNNVADLRITIF